uniref:Elongator complex protein 1 n=1 Tax=Lygus hesperus TaxID=30085 RepID=A0A0K8SD89_LYGHE
MKNLKLFLNLLQEYPELENPEFVFFSRKPSRTTDFISSDEVAFFFKDGFLHTLSINEGTKKSFSLAEVFDSAGVSTLVSVMFNDLNEEFYSFHQDGEVFSFRIDTDGNALGQPLDSIDGGVLAVEWSSDEELGVVINNKNELFIVTSTCQVVNYWDLQDEMEGEQKFINVGWGKKETQFQGSAGKAAAFAKPEQVSGETCDDHTISVTWRGDSSQFAVSYWCSRTSKRRIKIFNRDGVLQCCGEDINGLEAPLSWRPQGNLISMVQRLPNKYVVAFMEKNGLKHYDFTLPAGLKVVDLCWNHDSQILCTTCYNDIKDEFVLLFWVSQNYHWYLKQSFNCSDKPVAVSWDSKRENRVKLALKNGSVHILEFIWTVDHSGYSCSDDKSYVSVIDNEKLLVTQFSAAVIPPPMAMWTLDLLSVVSQVCYPLDKSQHSLAAVCNTEIRIFSKDENGNLIATKILQLPVDFHSKMLYSWVWISENRFACLESYPSGKTGLVAFGVSEEALTILWKVTLDFPVVQVMATEMKLILGKSNGNYLELSLSDQSLSSEKVVFPELCLDSMMFKDQLIGLSEIGRLYINSTHIASNITSFLVSYPFLIATTSLHTLLILKFTDDNCEEVSRRKLENGSKLVLTSGTFVVLQLPRGNLETIHPRALIFLSIGSLLDNQRYCEAVQLLRKNRILLDVCVDHDSESFLRNVGTFVDQVDPQSLVILVSEMSSSDVTSTTYSSFYDKPRSVLEDKINKVCSALLEEMRKTGRNKDFTLAILSCLVKSKKMNEAIKLADSDQALQHLLFLVPVEKLYSYALEAYNLPAALKIAGKSQMDPKEYIPYLNTLREMDPHYMKFTIAKSLKKYSSALSHLASCGTLKEEECFTFINDHCLYKDGMAIFGKGDERYKKCAFLYGEFLFKKRLFEEAGCMFSRSGDHVRAIEAFCASFNWHRATSLARAQNYSKEEMAKLGESLYERLMSASLFKDAAQFGELHLGDCDRCIDAYTQAYMWDDALRVASTHDREDLIDARIKPRLIDYANSLLSDTTAKKETLLNYIDRIKVVRVEKSNKPKFQEFGDDMSETSSVSTRSGTSHTSKSSKMTRKANRKLWSLKQGNPREEEALLSALRELYLSAEKSIVEVKKVCGAMMFVEMDLLAHQLQQETKQWVSCLQKCLPTIWPKDPNEEPTAAIDAMIRCAPEIHIPSNWELESISLNM